MKKILLYSISVAFVLLLWGCPYQSIVPLGEAKEKVTEKIIGTWVAHNEVDKENPAYYIVDTADSIFYTIDHFTYNDESLKYVSKNYVGHTTVLGGKLFLNVQEVGHKDYLIHRIEYTFGNLVLYEVTDNLDEKFSTSKEMQEFFLKYMHLSFFFNKEEVVLVRKKEVESE